MPSSTQVDDDPMEVSDAPARDVVVVGAGLAGLTAARSLPGRDVLLLEAEDRPGGRIRSDDRAPYWLNYGAHLFGSATSPVGELIDACGVETVDVEGSFTAMAFPGRLIAGGGPATLLRSAPLPLQSRIAFARTGLKILRHSTEYRRFVESLKGRPAREINRELNGFMNDRTFAELLGPLPRELDRIYRAISNRAQAEPEELSAGAAMSAFALVFSKDRSLGRAVAGGSGRLVERLVEQCAHDINTGARVTSVAADRDGVTVDYVDARGPHTVRAGHVVVTTPPHIAAEIIQGLPEDTAGALKGIRFGPSIVLSMLTRERRPMPWDDIYSAIVPGKSFNMLFNQANVLRSRETTRQPGGSLMVYASGALGRRLLDLDDERIVDLFLRDLYDVFPELIGLVGETHLHRWEYATSFTHPGRAALQPALDRDLGPITLAGDYLGAWFTDSAVITGQDAAARAQRRLPDRQPAPAPVPGSAGGEEERR
jgi:oxygen-dependent protoporphyrinogen oxidase